MDSIQDRIKIFKYLFICKSYFPQSAGCKNLPSMFVNFCLIPSFVYSAIYFDYQL